MLQRSFCFDPSRAESGSYTRALPDVDRHKCRRIPLYLIVSFFLLFCGAGRCYAQPLAVTAVSTVACSGPGTITITAIGGAGAGTYQYAVDALPFQASPVFTDPTLLAGPHTVHVTDGVTTADGSIIIGCITIAGVTKSSAVCGNNGSFTIATTGGTAPVLYSIDGVNFQASGTFSGLGGGTYTITIIDAGNTVLTTTTTLFDIIGANVTTTETPATCLNNDGGIVVSATGGVSPLLYSLDNSTYGATTNYGGLASGEHTVLVKDGNGCVATARPTVPLSNNLTLTPSADAAICQGKSTQLNVTANLANTTYSWTPATGLSSTTIANPVANPTTTTTYLVKGTFGVCTQPGTVTVTVNPAPVADAGLPVTTCYGKSVQLKGSGSTEFKWLPLTFLDNATLADPTVVQPTATTVYHLMVTDNIGCTSLNDASVTVTVTPPPQLFAGNDTNVVAGEPVPLHAVDVINSGFTQWLWTPADGLNDPTLQSPVLGAATQTVTYIVTATTDAGCKGVDTMTVKVFAAADLYVPNAFSPNHDGHNDVLRVIAPSMRELKAFSVYDRWGAQVFTTANAAVGWDGMRNGKAMAPGVYVWMAVGVDYQGRTVERRGTVMLVR